jgi:hypothetical protein
VPRVRSLLVLAAIFATPVPSAARAAGEAFARLALEPESTLTLSGQAPAPLAGSIEIRFESFPPALPAAFEVSDLDVAADGIAALALEPGIASPGLGVLFEDGAFLVPTLFLAVDLGGGVLALALPDVEGTLDLADPEQVVLETSFEVALEGATASVAIVAAPEPERTAAALAATGALAALAAGYSSRRASGTRCQRSGNG